MRFLCIEDVAHLNCHTFSPIFGHFHPFSPSLLHVPCYRWMLDYDDGESPDVLYIHNATNQQVGCYTLLRISASPLITLFALVFYPVASWASSYSQVLSAEARPHWRLCLHPLAVVPAHGPHKAQKVRVCFWALEVTLHYRHHWTWSEEHAIWMRCLHGHAYVLCLHDICASDLRTVFAYSALPLALLPGIPWLRILGVALEETVAYHCHSAHPLRIMAGLWVVCCGFERVVEGV